MVPYFWGVLVYKGAVLFWEPKKDPSLENYPAFLMRRADGRQPLGSVRLFLGVPGRLVTAWEDLGLRV